MKPIIFVRTAEMKYYRGISEMDMPRHGGSYVSETGFAHECYNFDVIELENKDVCLGFAMLTGGNKDTDVKIHIENIPGCELFKGKDYVEGVTVVWCAKSHRGNSVRVVGFYKNATVYRHHQYVDFYDENDELSYIQEYNFKASKEDCILLPYNERYTKAEWYVPTSGNNGYDFGFGRYSIWYAGAKGCSKKEIEYAEKMLKNIEDYSGENWIDKEVL